MTEKYYIGYTFTGDDFDAAVWCDEHQDCQLVEIDSVDGKRCFQIQSKPAPTAAELLEQAKAERAAAVAALTVEVDGMVFDGDEKAMRRMSNALTAAQSADVENWRTVTVPWVLANNIVVTVTMEQLARALRGAMEYMAEVWVLPYTN